MTEHSARIISGRTFGGGLVLGNVERLHERLERKGYSLNENIDGIEVKIGLQRQVGESENRKDVEVEPSQDGWSHYTLKAKVLSIEFGLGYPRRCVIGIGVSSLIVR